jgi:hypothetical protein
VGVRDKGGGGAQRKVEKGSGAGKGARDRKVKKIAHTAGEK